MPERLDLQGTALVDSAMLRILAMAAERDSAEYQIPKSVLERLDPEGQHIVCCRPKLIPGADTSRLNEESNTGYVALDITMGTPLPCEILTKLDGQHAPSKQMLSIIVRDYMKLEQLHYKDPTVAFHAVDGQRRKQARFN